MSSTTLPVLSQEAGLVRYLAQIKRFPMLSPEEEYMLAKAWINHQDRKAAHRLITSHLRLVVSIAAHYKNYGLPMIDLIAEGNIGLMQAVRKFDPDKGFKLATYAMWWIRAAIQDYILRSWSLVKIGTTTAQKKLFFNLKKAKTQIEMLEGRSIDSEKTDMMPHHALQIAHRLGVSQEDVLEMNQRITARDYSLNAPINTEEENGEWQDWIVDEGTDQEMALIQRNEIAYKQQILHEAFASLPERDADILKARFIQDPPMTLEALADQYAISRERVRQIEMRAYEKLKKIIREKAGL